MPDEILMPAKFLITPWVSADMWFFTRVRAIVCGETAFRSKFLSAVCKFAFKWLLARMSPTVYDKLPNFWKFLAAVRFCAFVWFVDSSGVDTVVGIEITSDLERFIAILKGAHVQSFICVAKIKMHFNLLPALELLSAVRMIACEWFFIRMNSIMISKIGFGFKFFQTLRNGTREWPFISVHAIM